MVYDTARLAILGLVLANSGKMTLWKPVLPPTHQRYKGVLNTCDNTPAQIDLDTGHQTMTRP